ncbi:nucleotidyltransferase family protein [Halorhodospira sp. 9621]|uniref:N-acetylmuramate alpha-1-phosphate uridylyltransferase MurU n=1 Tax=Halorhodospira TaxID=85108 RepID=UPI00191209CE|nr:MULTISPECIES: nucleotidyltransferase family protein [Halorhodospira]MBK5937371.1 mannose-1-phosphate guanylyltransferase [Halorhodospira halophila]MBK5943396.1 mannose-1-phosphate guanylyltransferase [Halorhodospira halophila]MCG5526926.1 nucleotidyltransferase family protein [Halorhodospira halophila]MCG5534272.1 nucleotidyltransferase family protein [Halorhodospira sp. 9621]MCG5539431.1 nucleotidyltransferase family protein [Halorhodospira sp. 9622]
MRAMILAAGRGERMRPLTDTTPKPLLEVAGMPLIGWQLQRLSAAGVETVVINTAWLGEQIETAVGDGRAWGVRVHYSREPEGALDTGGGIRQALPLLGDSPFWVVNGDVWSDYPLQRLPRSLSVAAHLVLVDNPAHNPDGDFALDGQGRVTTGSGQRLTFAGIGAFHPRLWRGCRRGCFPLAPLLRSAAQRGELTGTYWPGIWSDIGTPERLEQLRRQVLAEAGPAPE